MHERGHRLSKGVHLVQSARRIPGPHDVDVCAEAREAAEARGPVTGKARMANGEGRDVFVWFEEVAKETWRQRYHARGERPDDEVEEAEEEEEEEEAEAEEEEDAESEAEAEAEEERRRKRKNERISPAAKKMRISPA